MSCIGSANLSPLVPAQAGTQGPNIPLDVLALDFRLRLYSGRRSRTRVRE